MKKNGMNVIFQSKSINACLLNYECVHSIVISKKKKKNPIKNSTLDINNSIYVHGQY
jgi:hypothetical protein